MRPKDRHLLPSIGHPVPVRSGAGGNQLLSKFIPSTLSSTLAAFTSSAFAAFIFLFSLTLLSSGCNRDDEHSGKYSAKGGEIRFSATGGNPSAATKSSADALSSGASLSAGAYSSSASGTSALSSAGGNSVEADRTYKIYYDFEKGENVEAPASGSSRDADGNLTQSSDTRFSGQVFDVSSINYERIEWVADDKLTISENGGESFGRYSDYVVTAATAGSGSKIHRSIATLAPANGNGLQWGTNQTHRFFAVYPAMSTFGGDGYDAGNNVWYLANNAFYDGTEGTRVQYQSITLNPMPNTQYCYKTGTRTYKSSTDAVGGGTLENWYEPDMKYAHMAAVHRTTETAAASNGVSLEFYPQFSSVEVKLLKPSTMSSEVVKLKSVSLKCGSGTDATITTGANVSFKDDISLFSVTPRLYYKGERTTATPCSHRPYLFFEPTTSTSVTYDNVITLKFKETKESTTDYYPELDGADPSDASYVPKPLSFTFMLLPVDITQLELELTLEVAGSDQTKTLKLQTESGGIMSWIPLPAYKKMTISNVNVSDTYYMINPPLNISYVGHNAYTSNNFLIDSYKLDYSTSPATKTAVTDIEIEYSQSYSPADTPSDPSSISESEWSSSSPFWLGGGSGLAKQSADLTYRAQISSQSTSTGTSETIDYSEVQKLALQSNGVVGSKDAPIDLSMQRTYPSGGSFERAAGQPVTANCYVVRAAGWYMFPLIYGNSIDFTKNTNIDAITGSGNQNSFRSQKTPAYDLEPLAGNPKPSIIHSIYNSSHLSYDLDVANYKGFVVWEDTDGSSPVADNNSISIVPWSEISAHTTSTLTDVPYLRFYISPENIKECNFVLALGKIPYTGGDPEIIWSWHIWVTPEDLTPINLNVVFKEGDAPYATSHTYNPMPVPLGWCSDKTITGQSVTKYNDYGDCWVRVYQRGRKNSTTAYFKISHRGDVSKPQTVARDGNYTVYQWGRKDPFPGGDFKYQSNKVVCINKPYYTPTEWLAGLVLSFEPETNDATVSSVYNSIRYPYKSLNLDAYRWAETNENFWNNSAVLTASTTKTIYDPCPPDFAVPGLYAHFRYPKESQFFTSSSYFVERRYSNYRNFYRYKKEGTDTGGWWIPEPGSPSFHSSGTEKPEGSSSSFGGRIYFPDFWTATRNTQSQSYSIKIYNSENIDYHAYDYDVRQAGIYPHAN